jgi:phosphate transport system permease protein
LFGASARDRIGRSILLIFSIITSAVIVGILLMLIFEASYAMQVLGFGLFGPIWRPDLEIYGIAVFIAGTLWVSGFAILFAVPMGLLGALFIAEYSPSWLHKPMQITVELMAAIPSIVYGLWAMNTLVPFLESVFSSVVPGYRGFGVLAGAIILGVMLLPTVVAVSVHALLMVPDSLREASLALGASRTETSIRVVLTTAIPGIGAAVLLSLGRAIGETMAVLMVTGNALVFPMSLFDPTYVMTSIIANQLGYAIGQPLHASALYFVALILLVISILFVALAKLVIRWGMRRKGLL